MTDHQHPTAKPEANWRTCSRAEYDALPDLSAKPEGEGAPTFTVDELAQEIRRVDGQHSLGAGALAEALTPFLLEKLTVYGRLVSASPPVTAVAGAWDSLIDYLENQTAETEEGRAIIAEWIAQAKALNGPTPSADQSGVIGALVEALTAAEPLIETLHSIVTTPEVRKVVWRDLSKVRQALAAHAASIGGKS